MIWKRPSILKKLHNISVRNSEPLWFQDYLTRTKQYVHLNVAISYLKRILFDVPQSSRLNLGVLCFLSSTSMTCPNIPPFILRFLLLPQNWLPLVLISSHCMNLSTETIKVLWDPDPNPFFKSTGTGMFENCKKLHFIGIKNAKF